MPALSWGLLVATKDRLEELRICVELSLKQTRPPAEVIVIDASADWEKHAAAIGAIVRPHEAVRFVYRAADLASLTVQRNQAIGAAEADIVFLIDDDSFMHPDCAEEILRVYEADSAQAIAGVQASLSGMPQGRTSVGLPPQKVQRNATMIRRFRRTWILNRLLLYRPEDFFIPYDGAYPQAPLPDGVREMNVAPTKLFHGARMTFRRQNIREVLFDPLLRYYCPSEDLDASYRVSRTGCLLTARQASLHHYTTASSRIDRTRVAHLGMLNQAVLLRRHSPDTARARRAYYRLMPRRILAEFLKDAASRRVSLPQCRGALRALRDARKVFGMSDAELESWYPAMQERILKGGPAKRRGGA